jgi:septal ring-binding cell division protein DamX
VPVADGGGRLTLSDTLSRPPAAEPAPSLTASTEPVKAPEPEPAAAAATVAVGPGLGPLTAARLAATRDWLQSADDRHFSIQLLLTDFARRANLEKFLRERQAAGEVEDYFVFETRIRSNVWFGVLYKEYPSFGAARDALEELPEEFRDHQPFIRNVRDIATLG